MDAQRAAFQNKELQAQLNEPGPLLRRAGEAKRPGFGPRLQTLRSDLKKAQCTAACQRRRQGSQHVRGPKRFTVTGFSNGKTPRRQVAEKALLSARITAKAGCVFVRVVDRGQVVSQES